MAGTIAVINSMVAGVFAGLLAGVIADRIADANTSWRLAVAIAAAVVTFGASAAAFFAHQSRVLREDYGHRVPAMFPVADSKRAPYPVKGVDPRP
jgi:MFS family permease